MSKRCPECRAVYATGTFCPEHKHSVRLVNDVPETVRQLPAEGSPVAAGTQASGTPEAGASPRGFGPTARRAIEQLRAGLGRSNNIVLPLVERQKGWMIDGDRTRSEHVERWPVLNSDGRRGLLLRYSQGVLTAEAAYRIADAASDLPAPTLFGHGVVDADDNPSCYEIVAASTAEPLESWLKTHSGEDTALYLEQLLLELLEGLRACGLRAVTLDPSMLALGPDGVELSMLGALTPHEGASFHEHVAQSVLLRNPWAPPEARGRHRLSLTGDVFSAGQILARAVFGEACHYADLSSARVPFQRVADERLQRVMMGLLWPEEEDRWTVDDWRSDDAPAPPWARLRAGAAQTSFSLGGQAYWHAPELLAATRLNWDEAIANLAALLAWLDSTPYRDIARFVAAQPDHSNDWRLVRLCRMVSPDAPLFWRNLALGERDVDATLINLAQRVLTRATTDSRTEESTRAASAEISAFFAAELRGSFGPPPGLGTVKTPGRTRGAQRR